MLLLLCLFGLHACAIIGGLQGMHEDDPSWSCRLKRIHVVGWSFIEIVSRNSKNNKKKKNLSNLKQFRPNFENESSHKLVLHDADFAALIPVRTLITPRMVNQIEVFDFAVSQVNTRRSLENIQQIIYLDTTISHCLIQESYIAWRKEYMPPRRFLTDFESG